MFKYLDKLIFGGKSFINDAWKEIHNSYEKDVAKENYINYKEQIKIGYKNLISEKQEFDIELEKEILKHNINEEKSQLDGIFSSILITIGLSVTVDLVLNNLFQKIEDDSVFMVVAIITICMFLLVIIINARFFYKLVCKDSIKKGYYRLRLKVLEEIEEENKEYQYSLKIKSTVRDFMNNEATIEDFKELEKLIKERRKQL